MVLTSAVVQVLEAGLATEDDAVHVAGLLKSKRQLPGLYAATGCLIPRPLDQRFDGVKPEGRTQAGATVAGVVLTAGKWRIPVEETRGVGLGDRSLPTVCSSFS